MAIPLPRRPLFALLDAVLPDLDHERIWHRRDVHEPLPGERMLEQRLDELLRPWRPLLRAGSLLVFAAGIAFVWGLAPRVAATLPTAAGVALAIACGVLVHGLFILIVHEATHGNVLGAKVDRWVATVAMGALLLPFMAEAYQGQHLLHHRVANEQGDTNWTPLRHAIWKRSRLLYALYELIPVLNNIDRLRERWQRDPRRVALAWGVAALVVVALRPGLSWYALVLVGLNTINALRLWTEHFGHYRGRVSNSYWCPLSFGVGNHDIHHLRASISAHALIIGFWFRRVDGTVFSSPFKLLFARDWAPFRTQQADFDGANV